MPTKNPLVHGKMKALFPGKIPGVLEVREVPVPEPDKGEVLVKMAYAPLNPSDINRLKSIGEDELAYFIPGLEGSGIVVRAGKGILPAYMKGKRVACNAAYSYSGTWAEYMVTKASRCFPLPGNISDEQGAMLFVNPMTALAFRNIAVHEKHKAVISQAAGSALGQMVLQLLQKEKITVINLVRSDEQEKRLKSLSGGIVINTNNPDCYSILREVIHAFSPTLFLDPVGGEMHDVILSLMPENSKSIIYGTLSGEKLEINPRTLIAANKTITGFFLGHFLQQQNGVQLLRMVLEARRFLSREHTIQVREHVPLEKVQDAIQQYMQNMSAGKFLVALRPDN